MSTKTLSLSGFLPAFIKENKTITHRSGHYAPAARPAIRRRGRTHTLRGLAGTMSPSGISNLSLALVGAVVMVAVLYIFGINTYAAKGYEIKALQNQITQAQIQSDSLTLKTAELSSMTNIDQAVVATHLVPVTAEEFLRPQSQTAFVSH
jgi:hypothetical protein